MGLGRLAAGGFGERERARARLAGEKEATVEMGGCAAEGFGLGGGGGGGGGSAAAGAGPGFGEKKRESTCCLGLPMAWSVGAGNVGRAGAGCGGNSNERVFEGFRIRMAEGPNCSSFQLGPTSRSASALPGHQTIRHSGTYNAKMPELTF